MKKILLAAAVMLSLTAAPALADETTSVLEATITQLREKVADRDARIVHKNRLLGCERDARRTLERALRTGEPVGRLARCR